jgi:hypothetical protein
VSFFYFTTLGAIYFYILIAVCGFAIWRGRRDYRLFGFCVLGVFLADRTLLATMTNEAWMIGFGALAEFWALAIILLFSTISTASRAIAFLFLAKMFTYLGLLSGIITFQTMAAWTELFGYLQMIIIGGGTLNGYRHKLANNPGNIPSRDAGILSTGKGEIPPQ